MIFYFKDRGYYVTTFKTYTAKERAKMILFNGAGVDDFVVALVVDGVSYYKKIK